MVRDGNRFTGHLSGSHLWLLAQEAARACRRILESQALIGLHPLRVHVFEDRDVDVRIVKELHRRFAWMRPQQTPDVLDELALEGNREGQEQRVNLWAIEAFPKILACCDQ